MIIFKENELDVDTYLALRKSVKWKILSKKQAEMAIANSLYTVCAYDFDRPIGMGRLVGDGAVICYVQDLVIHPDAQYMGIGGQILSMLIAYAEGLRIEGTELMLDLMCAKGREQFYERFGFIARPTEQLGPGMIQYLKGEKQ